MQIVLLFFSITVLFCLWNPRYEDRTAKAIYWTLCTLLIFAIGFRGDIDRDYSAYVEMFSSNSILVEPMFVVIRFLARDLLRGDVTLLMLFYALIGVTLKFTAIKRHTELVFPSLLIWMGNLMIVQDMTQVRASVACSIMLLSTGALFERRAWHYFGWTLLAMMFHMSALLMLPLWFITGKRINKWMWTGIVVAGYALSIAGVYATTLLKMIPISFVRTRVQMYEAYSKIAEEDMTQGASIFGMFQMTRIAMFLLLLWNAEKITSHNKYAMLLLKIMACGLIALPLFRNNLVAGLRITEMLTCVDILLFPMVIYLFRPRFVGKIIVVIYSAAILYGRLFVENLLK